MLQLYKTNDEQNEMHTLCAWSNAAKTGNAYMSKNGEQDFCSLFVNAGVTEHVSILFN